MDNKDHKGLRLSRETVRELDAASLRDAAGGQMALTNNQGLCASLVPTQCCTGYYPSINAPCGTN